MSTHLRDDPSTLDHHVPGRPPILDASVTPSSVGAPGPPPVDPAPSKSAWGKQLLHRSLRRQCQRIVDSLGLPRPFSVEALCHQLAEQRSRPLHLMPLPPEAGTVGACGLWLSTSTSDFIFAERNTSLPHQEHIVLHEIGHMLFDHRSVSLTEPAGVSEIFSDLGPDVLRRFLARTNYSTRHEQEAEMLASLIRTTADESGLERPLSVLSKLEAALGVGNLRAR